MWPLLIVWLLSSVVSAQMVTVTGALGKFNSTPPAADQAHKLAAATACNNANVGTLGIENPAPNTYCVHGGTDPVANGKAIWGSSTGTTYNPPPPNGALAKCLADVQGTGSGVPTNGCVVVLDAQPIAYTTPPGIPQAGSPPHSWIFVGGNCQKLARAYGTGCNGWMPPTIQANPAAPQRIYFITTQYSALPPVGTRVNPSDVLPGDGYSHPLNLQPNINPKTQMGLLRNTITSPFPTLFFSDGPMYYQFEGFEVSPQTTTEPWQNMPPFTPYVPATGAGDPPTSYGNVVGNVLSTAGEGAQGGGRGLNVTNNGLATAYSSGSLHLVNTNFPTVLRCHMDSPSGPDMMAVLIAPNVSHTIFCDTIYTHLNQGYTTIRWSWNANITGDLDITMPALTQGGTKYSVNSGQCAAGTTVAYNPTIDPSTQIPAMGNVCVVDTSLMCDGVSVGQCFKVQFIPVQNATVATCSAVIPGTASPVAAFIKDNSPQCFNGGVHGFGIDTPPATAPAICFGPWANPAPDGSDCPQHWVGGGGWAAGTEHILVQDGIRVAFGPDKTPQLTISGCSDLTLGQPCEQSPIDGTPLMRFALNTSPHTYTATLTGSANVYWQTDPTVSLQASISTTDLQLPLSGNTTANTSTTWLQPDLVKIDNEYMSVTGNTDTKASGKLSLAVAATDTTVSITIVTNGNPAAGNILLIGSELMRVSAVTGCTATAGTTCVPTVVRGLYGQTPTTHAVGDPVTIEPSVGVTRAAIGTTAAAHNAGAIMVVNGRKAHTILGGPSYLTLNSNNSATFRWIESSAGNPPKGNVPVISSVQLTTFGGGGNPYSLAPKYQNPGAEIDNTPRAFFGVLSSSVAPYYGIDFCSIPTGDGSLGPIYSRFTENQVVKGRAFTIRCYLYIGAGSKFNATGLACPQAPCPDSYTGAGLDFGPDIAIDSVNVVDSTTTNRTLDITGFVCDTSTPHQGCTPQISASMGSYGGPWFEHMYIHGAGTIIHSGNPLTGNPDTHTPGTVCAGDVETTKGSDPASNWRCTLRGGIEIQHAYEYDGNQSSMRDSFIDNIYARVDTLPEAQPINGLIGSGPHEIRNNYISAGSEISWSGGAGGPDGNTEAGDICDVYLFHNYLYRPRYWLNYGVGVMGIPSTPGPKTIGTPSLTSYNRGMETKNLGEQKGGCRYEYDSNIRQTNFYGYVQVYTAIGLVARYGQQPTAGVPNLCCEFETDLYFHDEVLVNINNDIGIFGHDPSCGIGVAAPWCGKGVMQPWALERFYMYDMLFLQNIGDKTQSPISNINNNVPYQMRTGSLHDIAINHITFAYQGSLIANKNYSGFSMESNGPGPCPNPPTGTSGPMFHDLRNFWMLNTIFSSAMVDSQACGPKAWAIEPHTTTPVDISLTQRWKGNIWGMWTNTTPGQCYACGLDTTTNYIPPGAGSPNPLVVFKAPVDVTYLPDANAGTAVIDYTPTGNNTGGTGTSAITGQVLQNYIGNCGSTCATTDGLPSGYVKSRNDTRTAGVLTGVENASLVTTYPISGTVHGAVASGVVIQLSGGAQGQTITDSSGNYQFLQPNGSYTLTPSLAGFTFNPTSIPVTISGAASTGNNFAAVQVASTFTISGTVSGAIAAGVTITLGGAANATAVSDVNGNYSFNNLSNGSYTLVPSLTGYTFLPTSISATVNGANLPNQNFRATLIPTYTISGIVRGPASAGVVLTLNDGTTTTSNALGSYAFAGLLNGNYVVTPNAVGFVFAPLSQSVSINGADVTGVNFTSTSTAVQFGWNPVHVGPGILTAGAPTVALTWTPSPSAGVTSQCIYRGTTPGGEDYTTPVACFQNNTTAAFTDSSSVLVRGTTYYYTMQSAVGSVTSLPSGEVSALIPLTPGRAVRVTIPSQEQR